MLCVLWQLSAPCVVCTVGGSKGKDKSKAARVVLICLLKMLEACWACTTISTSGSHYTKAITCLPSKYLSLNTPTYAFIQSSQLPTPLQQVVKWKEGISKALPPFCIRVLTYQHLPGSLVFIMSSKFCEIQKYSETLCIPLTMWLLFIGAQSSDKSGLYGCQ